MRGHADVIRALAAAGVDLSAQDELGSTPATLAERYGRLDVIAALREAGVAC